MKKLNLLVVFAFMTGLLALPVLAQDGDSIVDNLASDAEGRFTTFVAALEAAGLAETLSAEGDFTVFAPTNDAIDAALESLGLSVDALLGDTETLTQILNYHIVQDNRVFFREFRQNETLPTVQGSALTLSVEEGLPAVDGVAISSVDRATSNGVYHIIDGVLLPPDVADTLTAAPEATEAGTETEAAEAAEGPSAMVRFAFLSPDATPSVLTLNGEPLGDGAAVESPSVTEWMSVPAGTVSVAGAPDGEDAESQFGPVDVTLAEGTWTTVAIVGSEADGTLLVQPVLEDYSPISGENARMTVFHAIAGAPPVDVIVDERVAITRLAYPATRGSNDGAFVIEVPAGTSDIQAIQSGTGTAENAVALVDLSGETIDANTNIFLALVGTSDAPEAFVETVNMDELAEAEG